jgi:hypothetical protein
VRFLAIASLLLAVAVPAAAAPWPAAHVKNTNGWIEALAMDGPRVVYAVRGGATCTKVFAWNVHTQAGAVVSGRGTCGADSTSTGGGVTQIAVAGTRFAWIVNEGGNIESSDDLYTASLPAPHERRVATAFRTGDVDGTLTGTWLSGLVGGGDRICAEPGHHRRIRNGGDGGVAAARYRPGDDRCRQGHATCHVPRSTPGRRPAHGSEGCVHVLSLPDGRDAVLATAPRAIQGLQIEAPGIVYAYNTVKGIRDLGNLAFVPMGKATSLLS